MAVVQMKDVDPERGLDASHLFRVKQTGRKKPDHLRRDDILFMGRGYRIFAALIEHDLDNTVAGPHFFILRLRPSQHRIIIPAFLAWYINHNRAQRYFSQHVAGTALPHINRTTLENLTIIVPPLTVQHSIVNAHRCRLREKALLEQLIDKKKQFLDQLLDQTLEQYQEDNA
jgi:Restriction endonuclease S subunits